MVFLPTWNGDENFCTARLNQRQKYYISENHEKLQHEMKLTTT